MRLLCCALLLVAVTLSQGQAPPTAPSQSGAHETIEQAGKECTQAKIDLVHAWAEELAEEDLRGLSWSELERRARTATDCSLMVMRARTKQRPDITTTDKESPTILAWYLDAATVDEAVSTEESRRFQDFLTRHNLLRQFSAEEAAGKR
jgi:hypothetical protein